MVWCDTGRMSVLTHLDTEAIRRAAERHGVAELSLFGSGVTADFDEGSDLDFLVDFLPGRADPFDDFCALREELIAVTSCDVDLVIKRAIRNPYFRESAVSRAEKIYVADV